MSAFIDGFSDELEKVALVGGLAKGIVSKLGISGLLGLGFVGYGGYQGAKAARNAGKKNYIPASNGRPSRAWAINYHRALGMKRNMSKLERRNQSINFAKYRERK